MFRRRTLNSKPTPSPVTVPASGYVPGHPVAVPNTDPETALLAALALETFWAKLDAFYLMVGSDRLVNRVNPGTYDLTLTGAVYATDIGIFCDGVNDLIDTNFNPTTAVSPKFVQNDASYGFWNRSSHPITTGTPMGSFTTSGCTMNGMSSVNGNSSYRINQTNARTTTNAPNVGGHLGLMACDRSASGTSNGFFNGVKNTTGTNQASVAPVNTTFKLGTANGSTFATPEMTFGAAFIGGHLTDAEHTQLYNLLNTFWRDYDRLHTIFRPVAYSWWFEPVADIQDPINNILVIGGSMGSGAGQHGAQCLMEIDIPSGAVISTKRLQDRYRLDDHHIVASKRLASGTRLVFMTGHGLKDDNATADNTLAVARSLTGRIADFGSISTISNTMTKANYGMMHQMTNGRVFVTLTVDGDKLIGGIYSDDDGQNWTVTKPWVTQASAPGGGQNQAYEKSVKSSGSTLRLFNQPHPSNTQNNIRVAEINTTTGAYTSGTSSFGSIYQSFGAALTDITNLSALTSLASGRSLRLLDVNSDGTMFLTVEFDNPGGANANYFLYRLTGTDYSNSAHWIKSSAIVAAGSPFWASSFYYNGAVFARESHDGIRLYIARLNSGTYYIERYDSFDNGSNWTVTEIKNSSTRLLRPVSTGDTTIPVIWQEATSYTDFETWSGMTIAWEG